MSRETILLTGASRGIGAAAARRLARPGRRLLLLARSEDALAHRASEVEARGAEARAVPVDFASPEETRRALDALEREEGPFDGLVLNAGMANAIRFDETDRARIERELEVNYLAPADILRRTLPEMVERGRGCVVVVGSLTSFIPFPGNATYCASKAALLALVRSLRAEIGPCGVHIGVVLPGYTRTQMVEGAQSLLLSMSAEKVGSSVQRAYDHKKTLIIPGALNGLAARLFGAFPGMTDRWSHHWARLVPARRS